MAVNFNQEIFRHFCTMDQTLRKYIAYLVVIIFCIQRFLSRETRHYESEQVSLYFRNNEMFLECTAFFSIEVR